MPCTSPLPQRLALVALLLWGAGLGFGCGDRKLALDRSSHDAATIATSTDALTTLPPAETPTTDASAPDVSSPDLPSTPPKTLIEFVLRNLTSTTVYYPVNCVPAFEILRAATHAVVQTNVSSCECDCGSPFCNGDLFCGACAPPRGLPILPDESDTLTWWAEKRTSELAMGKGGTFSCLRHAPLPSGDYIFAVDVYPTAEDAFLPAKAKRVEQPFTFGGAEATVEVPIR